VVNEHISKDSEPLDHREIIEAPSWGRVNAARVTVDKGKPGHTGRGQQ
jgi:hypothetical protein